MKKIIPLIVIGLWIQYSNAQTAVTFQLNLSTDCFDTSDGVFVLGSFNDYSMPFPLVYDQGLEIWSGTLMIAEGEYGYLFRIGNSNWESLPQSERTLSITGPDPIILPVVCFGYTENCDTALAPSEVSFSVHIAPELVPSGHTLWLISDFTQPAWQDGAIPMEYDQELNVWSTVVADVCPQYFNFRFAVGISNIVTNENWFEEDAAFSEGGCGAINAVSGDNRVYYRTDTNDVSLCFDFNSCNTCVFNFGCTDQTACNYNSAANVSDGSCIYVGQSCDDGLAYTLNDMLNETCTCTGIPDDIVCGVDIFISEYVEGFANNKAIELYNPTNTAVVLDGVYSIGRFRNGEATPMLMPITGTIQPYDVRVFALDKRDPLGINLEMPILPELEAVADTFLNPIFIETNSPFYFNGDDAVILIRDGSTIVDLIGRIGQDPGDGWNPPGDFSNVTWTEDHTMVRKPTVFQGVNANPEVFDPSLEWDTLSMNDFSHLGWHNFICIAQEVGCSNAQACNFTPGVINDPAMCIYPGCGDISACNYDPNVCAGGICIYPGCSDSLACNYDPEVCGLIGCIYPGCDDPAACNYTPGVCGDDSCIYPGCTDPEACNYDPEVCYGGFCIYPEIPGDTDCSGVVLVEDLIAMLSAFGCDADCELFDLDGDGIVGVSDLILLFGEFGVGE